METLPEQSSVAEAVPVLAGKLLSEQSIVMLSGQVIAGAVSSCNVISWSQVAALPQASIASQVRVMMYSCAHTPARVISANEITGDPSQLARVLEEHRPL